ncbi:MAG: hypothetical protein RL625_760 [Gemmatimonadota bacterium]
MPTTGFRAFLAPRLTPLKEHLLARIGVEPLPPREFEWLFVQSLGMRHWLTLQIADRFGCAGSLQLPFPRDLMTNAARWVRERTEGSERFSREALLWRVEHRLRSLDLDDPTFAPLQTFLAQADARMRAGLASRIADRLDDYQLFRPEILATWDRGQLATDSPHEGWQAALWRDLAIGEVPYPARIADRVLTRLREAPHGTFDIPSRLTVFGVSSLPERFIAFLQALGRHSDVTLYAAVLPEDTEHPLVRAWGAQGAAMQELLTKHGAVIEHLESITTPSLPLTATVQCHSTHGTLRELEVIRDQLLDAFANDPTLTPNQVLVLVPDVEAWGPAVETVFATDEPGAPRIPVHIADRPVGSDPAAEAFRQLLALESGRFTHTELFGILQHPMVRTAAGLEEEELERLARRTHAANVRWGFDASALASLGLPAEDMPSWREGLDRLLMGIVAGQSDRPILEVLPTIGETAGEPEALGRLTRWVERIAALMVTWKAPQSLSAWGTQLTETAAWYLGGIDRVSRSARARLIAQLRRIATDRPAGLEDPSMPIDFGVIREWLERQLADEDSTKHFLSGKVTVAARKPMRSIPFRVIAVAGLDDATFPRRDQPLAFDLIAQAPRLGDRSLREDDRQLFLDLAMAAEDTLILTWSGYEAATNAERARSVVVDELLDHLATQGAPHRVIQHPLQPFSPRYFSDRAEDRALFTYAGAMAEGASAPRAEAYALARTPIDPALLPDASEEITLRDLLECWENPAAFFCKRTLRLTLPAWEAPATDLERFALSPMERGRLRALMVRQILQSTYDPRRAVQRFLADGDLPPGALGRATFIGLEAEVEAVRARVAGLALTATSIFIQGTGWHLRGTLDGITETDRIIPRAGRFSARHRIRAWVEHVVMCAAAQVGHAVPRSTLLIGVESEEGDDGGKAPTAVQGTCAEVADPMALLDTWVSTLREAQRRPLPFFQNAGAAWLDSAKKGKPVDHLDVARKKFEPAFKTVGDLDDPYVALCFPEEDPLAVHHEAFERLARTLAPTLELPSVG